jgi:hypothetical protein
MNRTKINKIANSKLRILFYDKEIYLCEARLNGCQYDWILSFAHRHKRRWYYDKPDKLLWDFGQVILCCLHCHEILEKDSKLTEEIFTKLRV